MGDYYEGRSRSCWVCKAFVQNSETYRDGVCVRHAPDKIDGNLAAGGPSTPAGFNVFSAVRDPLTGFCGEFIPFEVAPPSVVPGLEPPIPS